MLYCLVLTKSRTAWIGLVVALAFWGACLLVRRPVPSSAAGRVMVGAAGCWSCSSVLFAVAALEAGFDVQVISEAPKSLDYRLQYWNGAMGVVREHPVFGVGPGNFRQHYLRFKLPESSEEIADPHNLILDLWTSGGLFALIGFAGCLIGAIAPFLRRRTDEAANDQSPERRARSAWSPASPRQRPRFSAGGSRAAPLGLGRFRCVAARAVWRLAGCVRRSASSNRHRTGFPPRLLAERRWD